MAGTRGSKMTEIKDGYIDQRDVWRKRFGLVAIVKRCVWGEQRHVRRPPRVDLWTAKSSRRCVRRWNPSLGRKLSRASDDDGRELPVVAAAEAGGISHLLASVEKTHPVHRFRRPVFGQHASYDSRSAFYFSRTVLQQSDRTIIKCNSENKRWWIFIW